MLDAGDKKLALDALERGARDVDAFRARWQRAHSSPLSRGAPGASPDEPRVRFEYYERELARAGFEIVRRQA